MRKIDTRNFQLATRATPREVNRQIVLNIIREHEPISRAELARHMEVARSALTLIVRELIESGDVVETTERVAGDVGPGRRPTLLRVRTSGRLAVAVDVRPGGTTVAIADFAGETLAREVMETPTTPDTLVAALADRIAAMRRAHVTDADYRGVGVVVPGMVDRRTGRVLYSPLLGWRNVDIRDALAARVELPVDIAATPAACALARLWLAPEGQQAVRNFAYVHVSDGVGAGLVVNGEVLRGETHTAGEFGHNSLDPHGPICSCGKRGCWEAFASNRATVRRYVDRMLQAHRAPGESSGTTLPDTPPTIDDVLDAARRDDEAAVSAIRETGWYIGRGLATVVNAFNPGRIYLGGEITGAWSLLEPPMREALAEATLSDAGRTTPVLADPRPAEYRLLGAVALVAVPTFAAPRVA
ncbi:ROK family protein [Gemmatirosa kalamazoonensis]|uniref:ROK family protein n=1 Tax=Gemmatirosa kalamazoonensis TaxID=861299 RepID=W0RGD7_9BACT|nr:ROK family transcriptional regulator [Gemmatirosa kalamazoonensis]AHG89395.1 ROK family protein [Gemmatirosa kalamazoonensis]